MAMLNDCKTALRVSSSNTVFDGEISDLISACQQDLILAGISEAKVEDDADILIKRAIVIYCKANFGYDNQDADRFQKSYNSLKMSLALSTDYSGGDNN